MSNDLHGDALVARLMDDLPVAVWVARAPSGDFVYANQLFGEIMGMGARDDVAVGEYAAPYGIHTRTGELYPEDRMPFVRALEARTTVVVDDITIHRADGRKVHIRAQARPLFDRDGAITYVAIAFLDVTREVEAELARADSEARLSMAQRMESIGKLAGGVAHDFNNLLAAIRVIATSLERDEADPYRREGLNQIDQAAESASQLTRALLGFARRGKNLAAPMRLDDLARGVVALALRSLDKRLELVADLGADPGFVRGDWTQLEQVLLNLLFNARDAMPSGGRIVVRTRARDLEPAEAARLGLDAGRSVVLEVEDQGTGIAPELRRRVFEPYFTTKTGGATPGTGLGLATVFGIAQAHNGAVEIAASSPAGTTMRVVLPELSAADVAVRPTAPRPEPRRGRGTVLVVEDEQLVNTVTTRALRELGYDVIAVANGVEAVEVFEQRRSEIGAVLLDMIMPQMDGHATYLALRRIDPGVRVLLTTGFALNEQAQAILDLGVRGFLPKPFDVHSLSEAIAAVLAS